MKSNTIPTNSLKEKKIEIEKGTPFAENEFFLPLVKNPSLLSQEKKNIIQYLNSQNFDKYMDSKTVPDMLWGISDCSTFKNKTNVFARCTDKYDMIIKMYHLALMTEQNDIAKTIQTKIITELMNYFKKESTSSFHSYIYKKITKIALACDCYETIKSFLYNNCVLQLKSYLSNEPCPNDNLYILWGIRSKPDYLNLLKTMEECELLDDAFAKNAKVVLEKLDCRPEDCYDTYVNLLNKASPNLVSDEEYKNFVLSLLNETYSSQIHFNFMRGAEMIDAIMKKPFLYNDSEIFSTLLDCLRPLSIESYVQYFVNKFHQYFETKEFEPWQNGLIRKAKKAAEKHYLKEMKDKKYPQDISTVVPDEKSSKKFTGPQTIFIILTLPKDEGAELSMEISPDLLLEKSVSFDAVSNLINTSLGGKNGHAVQVGLSHLEAFNILNQHSYYKYTSGAIAAQAIVDGSSLNYYSEASVDVDGMSLNRSSKNFPVLKAHSVIQSHQIIDLQTLDICDRKLAEKIPSRIVNKAFENNSIIQNNSAIGTVHLFKNIKTNILKNENEKSESTMKNT